MAVSPDTILKLIKCPLNLDLKNQITFTSKQAQYNYFNSLPKIEIEDITYQRKDNIIWFPQHIDEIIEYNYVMYKNSNYSDKWFYAFITNMEYENDYNTKITITTDVFQTWQFDLNYKASFVEREHISVSEDIPGANLLPEGLETGEFKVGGTAGFEELEPLYIVAFMGDKFGEKTINQNGYEYNGIFSSVTFFYTNLLEAGLNIINAQGNGDKILTVFTVPKLALWNKIPHDTDPTITTFYFEPLMEDYKETPLLKTLVSTPNTLDGYTPRNQKLRTYPYMYLRF